MSKNDRSISVSITVCYAVFVVLAFVSIMAPRLFNFYMEVYRGIKMDFEMSLTVYSCYYPCAALGIAALVILLKMLKRIKAGNTFCIENVKCMRVLSYLCFAVAIITAITGCFYIPFLIVTVAAGFLGVILRVVKNVLQSALELREENDLTI